MTSHQPKYTSLRDYSTLLRRQRWVVLAVTVLFGAIALALSLTATPSYTATSSVVFRDVAADLPLLGGQVTPELSAAERAARNRDLIEANALAAAAKRRLDTDVSAEALSNAVRARVGVETSFVFVEARWPDPEFAAAIANAFAETAVVRTTRQEEARLDRAIKGLSERFRELGDESLLGQFTLSQLSQLEALRGLSDPAQVTEQAEVPASPTSPRTTRNTILGVLVGLGFGLLAAFARDTLDRRIHSPHDAYEEMGLPVLGRIGSSALGSVGLAENSQRFVSPMDLESFRVLRTNLAFFSDESPPRTILVTSGLAEEGKSTVAASLASAAAAAGQRTLLVDCDLRRPTLAQRLNLAPEPGLAEYLAGAAQPESVLQVKTLDLAAADANGSRPSGPEREGQGGNPGSASFVFVAAGKPPGQPAELLSSERCGDFFRKVRRAYDLVVIDSSPMLVSVDPLNLVPLVDVVLVCIRVPKSTREQIHAVKSALSRLPERPGGIVVTGLTAGSADEYAYYGYDYISA